MGCIPNVDAEYVARMEDDGPKPSFCGSFDTVEPNESVAVPRDAPFSLAQMTMTASKAA
jgi:hypothetical protein